MASEKGRAYAWPFFMGVGMSKAKYTYHYPRPAVAVDLAIVSRASPRRVLLIRRKNEPYRGCWALPGGFIEMEETLEESARRELLEETGIVAGKLTVLGVYGDPGRDPRGRVITVTYLAEVDPAKVRPIAADDAAEVGWFSLRKPPKLAFDHAKMLSDARKLLR